MSIHRARKLGLLLAGFALLASPFVVTGVWAEAMAPSSLVPIPTRKPVAENASVQAIQVAVATNTEISNSLKNYSFKTNPFDSKSAFSDKQARLHREIFNLQRQGKMKEANKRFAGLNTSILMGHILAERYFHPDYRASYKELKGWLNKYADHPQASKIYKLALNRKNLTGKKDLKKPAIQESIVGNLVAASHRAKNYRNTKSRSNQQENRVQKLVNDIYRHVERREPTLALNILANDYAVQFIDDVEYDRLRAHIASGYLYAGKIENASKLAQSSTKRSGLHVPQAGWVNGLIHWQRGEYNEAARSFELAATSPYSSGWMVSASAYWTSRAHMRAGNEKLVKKWLGLAAIYPRTFYGLIATRALGNDSRFNWSIPSLTREHVRYIEGTKNGLRAAALLKSGQLDLAGAEIRNINPGKSIEKQQALIAYANNYRLPALSMRLANAFSSPSGDLYDAALYPLTDWVPANGYRIDKALIHAIVRQESRFHTTASNPSGATGLMQLMPKTANYVSGKTIYGDAAGRHQLKNPETNLEIGQSYIEELLNHKAVGQDLLSMAIAYNAGPGNLSKWKRERAHIQDPLLFIETIPFNETRAFVERVLSNYWIYRIRMDQETPSLDAVAKGQWARYAPQDSGLSKIAMR